MPTEYTCCFTGHRAIAPRDRERLPTILDDVLNKLISGGVTTFRTGGAMGFDTFAALAIIEKKQQYPHIKLHLFLPCRGQSDRWNEGNRTAYEYVLANADSITYTAENYTKGCMLHRDRKMVEGSDFCIAYCTKRSGGTAYTYKYAKEQGLKTINIAAL